MLRVAVAGVFFCVYLLQYHVHLIDACFFCRLCVIAVFGHYPFDSITFAAERHIHMDFVSKCLEKRRNIRGNRNTAPQDTKQTNQTTWLKFHRYPMAPCKLLYSFVLICFGFLQPIAGPSWPPSRHRARRTTRRAPWPRAATAPRSPAARKSRDSGGKQKEGMQKVRQEKDVRGRYENMM